MISLRFGCLLVTSCVILPVVIAASILFFLSYLRVRAPVVEQPLPVNETEQVSIHPVFEDKSRRLRMVLISDSENDFDSLSRFKEISVRYEPDIVVHLGDVSSLGVADDLVRARDIFKDYSHKIVFLPGDRDLWKSSGPKNFTGVFGQDYGLVDVSGFKLLFVNNADEYEGISADQFKFIEEKISEADFVFMHNPIVFNNSLLGILKKGMGQYSGDVDDQRVRLVSMIRGSSVRATFSGDQHVFSLTADTEKSSLFHVIVGSLSSARSLIQPSFVIYDLYEDGSFGIEELPLVN